MLRRLFAEAVGTFLLLFAVGVSAGEPFAVGGSLLCAMCLTGFTSGAHFNPAVTTGIIFYRWQEKSLSQKDLIEFLLYIIVQFVSAILGGLVGWAVVSYTVHFDITDGYMDAETFFGEMLYTVLLVSNALVVGHLIDNPVVCGGVISMTITSGDWAIGKITGGCFNPAIGFGINIINYAKNGSHLDHTWIYVLAPLLGGIIASCIARFFIDELEETKRKKAMA